MKKHKIVACTALLGGLLLSSCRELDLEPKGTLGESELFGNEFGVKKYFAALYNDLPIEDFVYFAQAGYRPGNFWEAGKYNQGNMSGEFFNTWIGVHASGFNYWPYGRVRDVNTFIENFPGYRDKYPQAAFNNLMGEAHFLRAFYYFGMAKRFGGVPLIKEAQNPLAPPETLEVPRSTEYDTWKFIYEDLKFAMDNMAEASERGRANKYVAAALLSRAMLYAGTNAKYTQHLGLPDNEAVQTGLAGMDPARANEFFQYCVDAGKTVEQGPYALYTAGYPDKATNFANVFLDRNSSESIFVKEYDRNSPIGNRLRHSYDAMMAPFPDMSSFVGTNSYPTLDVMELYDMPAYYNPDGTPVRFDHPGDIRNGMEPRLRGTMFFNGDELRGSTFSLQRGIYRTFYGPALDMAWAGNPVAPINSGGNRITGNVGSTVEIDGTTYNVTGAHGYFENRWGENNGFGAGFIRKYVNPNMPRSEVFEYNSDQHWVVFRLGEIYLNTAEALYELGRRDEAFDYIEKLRERAGAQITRPAIDMTPTNVSSLNRTPANTPNAFFRYELETSLRFIRDERVRELYAENHWWWDLRRWRTADRVLSGFLPRFLSAYYVADEGKYIYIDEMNPMNWTWGTSLSCYYEPIPGGGQKQLVQNPFY